VARSGPSKGLGISINLVTMAKDRKPFKETKLGQFLKVKVPNAFSAVGELLPDKGVLGIIKNIIDKDPGIRPEDRLEFERLLKEHEHEMFTQEVADRASARTRETEFVKATGHVDWMMIIVGVIGLAAFTFVLFVLVYEEIPEANRDLFIHAIGMVEGVAISIFAYYFGSSKGSADKNKLIK
jgi:hypothetical protein